VGLDISKELIERARSIELETGLGIEYQQGDAAEPDVLLGSQFDVIACNFGLSDIDELEGVCASVARMLVPGGRVVFSILHPCFAGAANVSGSWPSDGTYYDERWWRADGELSLLRREVGANHRMLSTYVNTLVRYGLRLEAMVEPQPEVSWTADHSDAAVQPVYLVVSCRLPAS
jgi:SAM-dependent methyltransferase